MTISSVKTGPCCASQKISCEGLKPSLSNQLPVELKQEVFKYLDFQSFIAARSIDSSWRRASCDSLVLQDQLRKVIHMETWPCDSSTLTRLVDIQRRIGQNIACKRIIGFPLTNGFEDTSLMAFSNDSRRVVRVSSYGMVEVWQLNSLRPFKIWDMVMCRPANQPIRDMLVPITWAAFSPSGHRLVVACMTGMTKIWNLNIPRPKPILLSIPHRGACMFAAFSPNETHAVTVCSGGEAYLWDITQQEGAHGPQVLKRSHGGFIDYAVFSKSGRYLVTMSQDGSAQIWDLSLSTPVEEPLTESTPGLPGSSTSFSASLGRWMRRSPCGEVQVWSLQEEPPRLQIISDLQHHAISCAAFSSDGSCLMVVGQDGILHRVDLRCSTPRSRAFLRPFQGLQCLAVSPLGRYVIMASRYSRQVELWDVNQAQGLNLPTQPHLGEKDWGKMVAFSRLGRYALVVSGWGRAYVYDFGYVHLKHPLKSHNHLLNLGFFEP